MEDLDPFWGGIEIPVGSRVSWHGEGMVNSFLLHVWKQRLLWLCLFSTFSTCSLLVHPFFIHSFLSFHWFIPSHALDLNPRRLDQCRTDPPLSWRDGAGSQEPWVTNDQGDFALGGRLGLGWVVLRACGVRKPGGDTRNGAYVSLKGRAAIRVRLSRLNQKAWPRVSLPHRLDEFRMQRSPQAETWWGGYPEVKALVTEAGATGACLVPTLQSGHRTCMERPREEFRIWESG